MAFRPFGMLLKPLDSDHCLTSPPRTTLVAVEPSLRLSIHLNITTYDDMN